MRKWWLIALFVVAVPVLAWASSTILNLSTRSPIDGTESVPLATAGANWKATLANIFSTLGRTKLTGATTFFVNISTGNDANGCTNSSTDVCLTVAHALAVAISNDFNGNTVTISVASATVASPISITNGWEGNGILLFDFNTGTVSTSSAAFSNTVPNSTIEIQNVTFNTSSGNAVYNGGAASSIHILANVTFGAISTAALWADPNASIVANTAYTVSGNQTWHIVANGSGANVNINSNTITLVATPTFAGQFVNSSKLGFVDAEGDTFAGTGATGQRCNADNNGVIFTNTSGSATYFPGTISCSTSTGGVYN